MEKFAVIITHLVAETKTDELKTSAQVFKTINLTAAFDEHCSCYLADEDETPEIVKPGVATLFVSFTIWDSIQAADTFQLKLKFISGINIEDYVFAKWKVSGDELPVLYEGFGKIWLKQNLSLSPQAEESVIPALLKSSGREWLMDALGPTEDPFVYDHWEIRKQPAGADYTKESSSQDSKNESDKEATKVSFVKQPFGSNDDITKDKPNSTDQHTEDEALINAKIQNFDRQLSSYNAALDKCKATCFNADYGRLANLTGWAQRILAMVTQLLRNPDTATNPRFLKHVQAEERKWTEALELFSSQTETQKKFELEQAKMNHDFHMQQLRQQNQISNERIRAEAERAKIKQDTNTYIVSLKSDTLRNAAVSYSESNEKFIDDYLRR